MIHSPPGDADKSIPDSDGEDTDECEDSQGKRTNLEFKSGEIMDSKAHSQAIAQAIVFGFTEFNRHRDLGRLIPTILLNHDYFIVMIYDPVEDSLMGPRFPVYFINPNIGDTTNPLRYLGIFILWLVLNHRFFFVKNVRGVEMVQCKFRKKMEKENKIREYEKLHDFVAPFKVHADMQASMEYPRHAFLVRGDKRKHSSSDSE